MHPHHTAQRQHTILSGSHVWRVRTPTCSFCRARHCHASHSETLCARTPGDPRTVPDADSHRRMSHSAKHKVASRCAAAPNATETQQLSMPALQQKVPEQLPELWHSSSRCICVVAEQGAEWGALAQARLTAGTSPRYSSTLADTAAVHTGWRGLTDLTQQHWASTPACRSSGAIARAEYVPRTRRPHEQTSAL